MKDILLTILGTLVASLVAVITFFFREWRGDRKLIVTLHAKISCLENELKAFHNGSSAAVVVDRVNTLWRRVIESEKKDG